MITGDTFEVLRKLIDCDYPFQWEPKTVLEIVPDDMVNRLTNQLNEKVFEDDFYFEQLMLYLGLSYEYAISGRLEEAVKIFETGETELREYIRSLPSNINTSVRHVMLATRAYLLLQQDKTDLAVAVVSEIPAVDSMNTENRAALRGLRAVFFDEYGISGTKYALELASKAIEMNPNEPMWYFLKGKYLGRLRRVERPYDVPQAEEIEFLRKAIEARENASYIIFTAQMYCETADRIYRRHHVRKMLYPTHKLLVDNLNKESLKLYNKAVELKPNCSHTMFRCAKGFVKLTKMICDKNLKERTRRLLEAGLKIAPKNGYGNHVMAQYYERIKKDSNKALKFLRICESQKIFGAVMDLIRLEYQSGCAMDFVQRLTDQLSVYEEKSRQCQIYSQLVSYHVFVTKDLEKACTSTYAIMKREPNSENMLEHRTICIPYRKTFNLYDLLVDEIKIRLQDEKRLGDKEDYYRKFLSDLSLTGQSVPLSVPRHLKNEILNVVFAPSNRRQRTSILTTSTESKPSKKKKKIIKIPQHVRTLFDEFHLARGTDVDRSIDEIFSRCQKELDEEKKNKPFVLRTGSAPTSTKKANDNSENEEDREKVNAAGESDESDDDAFRMMVYKKSKEHCNLKEASIDVSAVIVPPLEKVKIGDEIPSEGEKELRNSLDSDDSVDVSDVEYLDDSEDESHDSEASGCDESDDSDDQAFRMRIYERSKRKLKRDAVKPTTNMSTDIVTPPKKLRIEEDQED